MQCQAQISPLKPLLVPASFHPDPTFVFSSNKRTDFTSPEKLTFLMDFCGVSLNKFFFRRSDSCVVVCLLVVAFYCYVLHTNGGVSAYVDRPCKTMGLHQCLTKSTKTDAIKIQSNINSVCITYFFKIVESKMSSGYYQQKTFTCVRVNIHQEGVLNQKPSPEQIKVRFTNQ